MENRGVSEKNLKLQVSICRYLHNTPFSFVNYQFDHFPVYGTNFITSKIFALKYCQFWIKTLITNDKKVITLIFKKNVIFDENCWKSPGYRDPNIDPLVTLNLWNNRSSSNDISSNPSSSNSRKRQFVELQFVELPSSSNTPVRRTFVRTLI
jgi:hypothetical protein